MQTMDLATRDVDSVNGAAHSELSSPFARHELSDDEQPAASAHEAFGAEAPTSPFTESFATNDAEAFDAEVMELLVAELEDDEFAEALEVLSAEAARKYLSSPAGWNHEAAVPTLDPSDAEEWVRSISDEVDALLAELEARFATRPVESVTDEELESILGPGATGLDFFSNPLDARELFFGSLKKKFKKVAKAAKNVVKKGISLASKVMPLGIIYGRLRKIIRPLLQRVLGRAIGKLPRQFREPARRLARSYGLNPTREFGTELGSEFDGEFEMLAAEFDEATAAAMTDDSGQADELVEAEMWTELAAEDEAPNAAADLDAARERLAQQLLKSETGYEPIDEIEQFAPAAILPAVRLGIKIIGRRRVVNFVAKLLAKLIAPVVGRQLARPLSVQIADKGLALLKLEAEASSGRLAAEAAVATIEDTLAEVFAAPDELLESELYLESAVQEAFTRAAARYFPATALRPGVGTADAPTDDGVWVMMPRSASPLYRYRKFSHVVPTRVNHAMAREVVFSDGETLEDRLADVGETSWPVDVEVETYELLPTANIGHVAAFEANGEPIDETLSEFDTLDEAGPLRVPAAVRRPPRRRTGRRHVIRVTAKGKRLRRRSPVAVRLDVSGATPTLRLHLHLGERRALAIANDLGRQRHRDVVTLFRSMTNDSMRRVVSKRLGRMLTRRSVTLDDTALDALAGRLFDGTVGALTKQLPALAGSLASAAKDPARGLTLTAAFSLTSLKTIATDAPAPPTITVRPGRRRD